MVGNAGNSPIACIFGTAVGCAGKAGDFGGAGNAGGEGDADQDLDLGLGGAAGRGGGPAGAGTGGCSPIITAGAATTTRGCSAEQGERASSRHMP